MPSDLYRFSDQQSASVGLKLNGTKIDASPATDGYVHLSRTWHAGDVVELDLPMPIRRVYAHKNIEENRGKVALMRGPVVYCLEAIDHSEADVFGMALPAQAKLRAEHRHTLLGGLTVLHAQALSKDRHLTQLTAIPYYAWANRKKGPMTVWIDETE